MVEFGVTHLPTPTLFFRYGFGTFGIFIGGFVISPSVVIPFFLPGTTHTTVGDGVSLLGEDSSNDKYYSPLLALLGEPVIPSCFVASGVVPPPLWSPTLLSLFYSDVFLEASAGVGPGGCLLSYSAFLAIILAPLMVPRGLRDFPRHSEYLAPVGEALLKYMGDGIGSVLGVAVLSPSPLITSLTWL